MLEHFSLVHDFFFRCFAKKNDYKSIFKFTAMPPIRFFFYLKLELIKKTIQATYYILAIVP